MCLCVYVKARKPTMQAQLKQTGADGWQESGGTQTYMYIYIYTHVCMYVSMYVCVYIYIYIYMYSNDSILVVLSINNNDMIIRNNIIATCLTLLV